MNLPHVIIGFLLVALMGVHPAIAQDEQPLIGSWGECPAPEDLPELITIGAIFAQDGALAETGTQQVNGTVLAIEEINASLYLGDGTFFEVYVESSGGTVEGALSAAEKLVEEQDVRALLGPTLSSSAAVVFPFANEQGIPIMGVNTSAPGLTAGRPYVFRYNLPEDLILPQVARDVVRQLDVERVAMLYDSGEPFAGSAHRIFAAELVKLPVEVFTVIDLADVTLDDALVADLIDARTDVIFASAGVLRARDVVLRLRDGGFNAPIVGNDAFNNPLVSMSVMGETDGLITGATWHPDFDNPINAAFVANYQAMFDMLPDTDAAHAYASTWMLASAIRCAGSVEPDAIREALTTIELDSPFGALNFDRNREAVHPAVTQIVEDGVFVIFGSDD